MQTYVSILNAKILNSALSYCQYMNKQAVYKNELNFYRDKTKHQVDRGKLSNTV